MNEADQMVRVLLAQGWKEYPDRTRPLVRLFCKFFDTKTRCKCNDSKPGIQVCVRVTDLSLSSTSVQPSLYEIELAGELEDETWLQLHQWKMPPDIREGLKAIPRMLTAWESINDYHD